MTALLCCCSRATSIFRVPGLQCLQYPSMLRSGFWISRVLERSSFQNGWNKNHDWAKLSDSYLECGGSQLNLLLLQPLQKIEKFKGGVNRLQAQTPWMTQKPKHLIKIRADCQHSLPDYPIGLPQTSLRHLGLQKSYILRTLKDLSEPWQLWASLLQQLPWRHLLRLQECCI